MRNAQASGVLQIMYRNTCAYVKCAREYIGCSGNTCEPLTAHEVFRLLVKLIVEHFQLKKYLSRTIPNIPASETNIQSNKVILLVP